MNANSKQVDGTHYNIAGRFQHWDFVQNILNNCYLEGNASKYIFRHRRKNGKADVMKSIHYVEKLLENYQKKSWFGRLWHNAKALYQFTTRNDLKDGNAYYDANELGWKERLFCETLRFWRNEKELLALIELAESILADYDICQNMVEELDSGEPTSGYVNQ